MRVLLQRYPPLVEHKIHEQRQTLNQAATYKGITASDAEGSVQSSQSIGAAKLKTPTNLAP